MSLHISMKALQKIEERWRFHAKIHDVSTNLGKNLLLTPLLCVSLTRNAILSLKPEKWIKQWKDPLERESYLYGLDSGKLASSELKSLKWVARKSLFVHWKAATWTLSTEFAESRFKCVGSELKASFLLLSAQNTLKQDEVA